MAAVLKTAGLKCSVGSNPTSSSKGGIAQLVEHLSFKQKVDGSIPSAPTNYGGIAQGESSGLINQRSVVQIHLSPPSTG